MIAMRFTGSAGRGGSTGAHDLAWKNFGRRVRPAPRCEASERPSWLLTTTPPAAGAEDPQPRAQKEERSRLRHPRHTRHIRSFRRPEGKSRAVDE